MRLVHRRLAGIATVLADDGLPPPPPLPGSETVAPMPPSRDPIPVPDTNLAVPGAEGNSAATTVVTSNGATAVSAAPCQACEEDGHHCRACDYYHASCYGIKPLGACVAQHLCVQVSNGVAAQMMLYNYDFNDPIVGDPTKLSPYGLRHLGQMERWLRAGYTCPVLIEQNLGSATLDNARQMSVITSLGEAGLAPQVAVGDGGSGLSGTESLLIHVSRLQQFAHGGPASQGTSSSGSGSGSSGGSNSSLQGSTPQ